MKKVAFRPAEVVPLPGDPIKAKDTLGGVAEIAMQQMCAEMMATDLQAATQHALLRAHGHDVAMSVER